MTVYLWSASLSLNIKNPEAHELAAALARLTGESMTKAVAGDRIAALVDANRRLQPIRRRHAPGFGGLDRLREDGRVLLGEQDREHG